MFYKTKNMKKNKLYLQAMTLFEILLTVAMIGILYMSFVPNQASNIAKAKAIEAQSVLNHVYGLEKNYFYMYSKYSMDLEELGYEQGLSVNEGGIANYRVTIESATSNSFVAKAEAVVDFDADGQMNVWQMDQDKVLKEVVKD